MNIIAITYSDTSFAEAAGKLARQLKLPLCSVFDATYPIFLVLTEDRLELRASGDDAPGPVYVDFVGGALGHRLKFGGGRRQLIGRAVGVKPKETLNVLDLTAGLGRDAWVLANMGCDVTMIERSPIVAALLQDGLERAETLLSDLKLRLIQADAAEYLKQLSKKPDVIYLDPMFPPLKKSAAVKKEMRVLKQVVGEDDNGVELLALARGAAQKRIVVKRHRHAPSLGDLRPDLVFEGKSSRFDVYWPGV